MRQPFFAVMLFILAGCSGAPHRPEGVIRDDYATVEAYISRLVDHEMRANSVPGLSIAVVDDQRILWSRGFGFADREQKVPATAETLYRVGSITKLFTATACLQLLEQGRLNLDQPLPELLPGFAIKQRQAPSAEITPRLLMTHHSGLPRDRAKGFMTMEPEAFSTLLTDISDDYLAYPPGRILSYSNLGVSLLGAIVQRLSGQPYADYMRESVLAPLGMSTAAFETGLSATPLMARGYRGDEPALEPALRDVPAGGLNASVGEISRFMSMIFADGLAGKQRILQAATVAEMLRPQNAETPLDMNFQVGLGWMLSTLGNPEMENIGKVAHHSGATVFFRSQMYLLPEYKLGVVVLANSSTAGRVVDRVASEALALTLEAKTGLRREEPKKVVPQKGALGAARIAEYTGDYTTVAGFARIYQAGDGLRVETAGRHFNLVPGSDGLFRLDYALLGILHIDLGSLGEIGFSRRHVDGRDLLVARAGKQELLVGQRLVPSPISSAWRRRLGQYEIANLGADYPFVKSIRLIEERGFLLAELTMSAQPDQAQRIPLMPLSDTEARLLGPLGDGGEMLGSMIVNGEERIAFSGYLLRRVE